jgi:hypothetical protein
MTSASSDLVRRGDPRSHRGWEQRLDRDRHAAAVVQTPEQRAITAVILERARTGGAEAVALTGSTAQGARTAISDLDYHVVGVRPPVADLPSDVDVYATNAPKLWRKLHEGDDFVHWTLRRGLLLYDAGVFREMATAIVEGELWPDGAAKLDRLPELERLARRLIAVGDADAAQEHVRATLTSAARGTLLLRGIFAGARSQLPEQLRSVHSDQLADELAATIHRRLSLDELSQSLDAITTITAAT